MRLWRQEAGDRCQLEAETDSKLERICNPDNLDNPDSRQPERRRAPLLFSSLSLFSIPLLYPFNFSIAFAKTRARKLTTTFNSWLGDVR